MKKKIFFGFMFLACTVAVVFAHYSMNEIQLPESMVQEKMDDAFPVVGSKFFVKYELQNPVVKFQDDGTITLGVDGIAGIKDRFAPVSVSVNGVLDYNPLEGAFFFRDAKIVKFDMEEVKLHDGDARKIEEAARFALGGERFGKLKDFAKGKAGEKYREEFKEKAIDSIQTVILQVLERNPVYKLDSQDMKQQAAKLVINKIEVTDGVMHIKLSIFQGVMMIFLYALCALAAFGLAYSIFRSGGSGLAVVGVGLS